MFQDLLTKLRSLKWGLTLGILAAALLIIVNEISHAGSQEAVDRMAQGQVVHTSFNRLLQGMLNAESGQRGYLLTGDERYLEPYNSALSQINLEMDNLRRQFEGSAQAQADLAKLSHQISRKLAEMELSLLMRRQGNEDAWRFVLRTDVGMQDMEAVRQQAQTLIDRSSADVKTGQIQVLRSLMTSRVGVALIAVIGLAAFYMYLRQAAVLRDMAQREQETLSRERDRLEELVGERTASLSELANYLQQVREEERAHLARELHDELGALLTAAKLDVSRLKAQILPNSDEVRTRLDHLVQSLDSGIALKRRIIEDLRPSTLSNLGLEAALEILVKEYAGRAAMEVECSLEKAEDLPNDTQLTVYRLVQESLTNIAKYAEATRVFVSMHSHPRHVEVQVRDNGKGFDTEAVRPSSHGLSGMRHRVQAAGGRLVISSQVGRGSLVSAVFPLPMNAIVPLGQQVYDPAIGAGLSMTTSP